MSLFSKVLAHIEHLCWTEFGVVGDETFSCFTENVSIELKLSHDLLSYTASFGNDFMSSEFEGMSDDVDAVAE